MKIKISMKENYPSSLLQIKNRKELNHNIKYFSKLPTIKEKSKSHRITRYSHNPHNSFYHRIPHAMF